MNKEIQQRRPMTATVLINAGDGRPWVTDRATLLAHLAAAGWTDDAGRWTEPAYDAGAGEGNPYSRLVEACESIRGEGAAEPVTADDRRGAALIFGTKTWWWFERPTS